MKLLIHDYTPSEWERIAGEYKDCVVISGNGAIRPCIGCFCCWTEGEGECVFKDGYHTMCALIHEAEEMIIMTKYTYGGFSSLVKSVIDRCIGFVLPEFEVAYDEMHHQKRFLDDKLITVYFRGPALSETQKENARSYVFALSRNFRGMVKNVFFEECGASDEPADLTDKEAKRSGILMVECSPRGERSNTGVFLNELQKDLGCEVKRVRLTVNADLAEITEDLRRAKTVIFGIPLYVDGIPAAALRLFEKVKEKNAGKGCRFYAVVNNGLYESRQNRNLLNMLKEFCAENGLLYSGAAAIGAGEAMGVLMRKGKNALWPAHNAKASLAELAKSILQEKTADDIYADPFLFPRSVYIRIANANWQKLKKRG